jgi:hypothetical protein
MNPLQILIAILLFGAGASTGWVLHTPAKDVALTSAKTGNVATTKSEASRVVEEQALREKIRNLDEREAHFKEQAKRAILADRITFFGKYSLRLCHESFAADNPLSDELMELLQVTPAENATIKKVYLEARTKSESLQASHLTILTNTPDKLSFQISTYPEGAIVKKDLESSLSAILGKERFSALTHLKPETDSRNAYALQNFGGESTTITIDYLSNRPAFLTESWGEGNWSRIPLSDGKIPEKYGNLITIQTQGTR